MVVYLECRPLYLRCNNANASPVSLAFLLLRVRARTCLVTCHRHTGEKDSQRHARRATRCASAHMMTNVCICTGM